MSFHRGTRKCWVTGSQLFFKDLNDLFLFWHRGPGFPRRQVGGSCDVPFMCLASFWQMSSGSHTLSAIPVPFSNAPLPASRHVEGSYLFLNLGSCDFVHNTQCVMEGDAAALPLVLWNSPLGPLSRFAGSESSHGCHAGRGPVGALWSVGLRRCGSLPMPCSR